MKCNQKAWKVPIIIFLCLGHFFFLLGMNTASAFTDQIIQRGATGDDVVELQARLQYNGFYTDTIDGVYGWSTYWSVRKFQEEFGLDVDGLVGPQMKNMLERATEYHEDFVKKALHEGRRFTHYGGVEPFEIQKGAPGTRDTAPGRRAPGAEAPAPGTPAPGAGSPAPGTPAPGAEAPAPGTPAPGAGSPTPGTPAPGAGSPAPGAGSPAPGTPAPEAPAPEAPGEPVPFEEVPEEQDNEINAEKAMNVPDGFSDNDLQLMAQAVYGEARGEPYIGQVAVAAVVLNRINSPTFPNTVSGVIFEPRAFTAVADGQIWMSPDDTARRAVLDAINGQDPSGGATYYFNPDTATSGWIWSRPQIKKIGKHIFCN